MSKTNKENIEDIYPLSPMQEGMLFHELAEPGSGAYFEQYRCIYRGSLDSTALRKAWQKVVDLNPILRSLIIWERNDKPLQVVRQRVELEFEERDYSSLSDAEGETRLAEFQESDVSRGFDLKQAPLMRVALFRLPGDRHAFIWSFHHILLDGWSGALVLDTVYRLYSHFRVGEEVEIEATTPYSEFIAWIGRQDKSKAESYWRRVLKGFGTPTLISHSQLEQHLESGSNYEKLGLNLNPGAAVRLQEVSRENKITLNTIVQGAWAYLLSRYSRERDVVFGCTVSGRQANIPGVENMIGLFINTIPVRVKIDPEVPALDWLRKLQSQQIESTEYEFCPLAEVQKWSEIPKRQALFHSILIFENYPATDSNEQGLEFSITDVDTREQTNYPLTIGVEPANNFLLNCTYDIDRFDSEEIKGLLRHFRNVLENVADAMDKPITDCSLLDESDSRKLKEWNSTRREFESACCIHDLVARRAEMSGDKVAVLCNGEKITYKQLDQSANRLANYLISRGVEKEELVGLSVERSIDMIVAMLAILKAGAAYLPLDPAYPKDRNGFILNDANTRFLVTGTEVGERLPDYDCTHIDLDSQREEIDSCDASSPGIQQSPDNLAYVIYTSGSTGKPKGVKVPHSAVVNFLSSMAESPGLDSDDRLLAVTTLSFDIAVLELFLPLTVGASLYLADRDMAVDGDALISLIDEQNITVMQATPSTWRLMLLSGWQGSPRLKALCGGEALNVDLAEGLIARVAELWNMYGPTESTVWSTVYRLDKPSPVLIGTPIANTRTYVLNADMQQQPIGLPGELYIGGAGVTKGYLNRDQLTQERFLRCGVGEPKGELLYRTGDLVRYLPDGNLQYIDRLDNQIKLRGFRIELGEIESVLASHPDLKQVVVALRREDSADARLVAYYLTDKDDVAVAELRKYLRSKLPDFMMPQHYVELEEIPTMPNGKIDRAALPAPTGSGRERVLKTKPRNEFERLVAQVWREVLNIEEVGIEDNFFEVGGHSLLSVKVIAMIKQQTGVKLELRSIVMDTLEHIAATLERTVAGKSAKSDIGKNSLAGSITQKFKSVLQSSSHN